MPSHLRKPDRPLRGARHRRTQRGGVRHHQDSRLHRRFYWYGYTYKTHLQGAQSYWRHLKGIPKKLLFLGHAHLERPFHGLHHEIVRWYDHWLKGIDTGILDEPPVRYWVSGANEWRTGTDWPLPETEWTKLYLTSWERLRSQEFTPGSADDLIPLTRSFRCR